MKLNEIIARDGGFELRAVNNVIRLIFDESATVPFVSRYRKEATGGLDEVAIGKIKSEYERLTELEKRKETIISTIEEQGKLTDELRVKIVECYDTSRLEDLYLPYKPKRRTRATIARERGLEPLAAMMMKQNSPDIDATAQRFVKGDIESAEQAIDGARDIIAEWVSESDRARGIVRRLFGRMATISSRMVKGKEEEGAKYSDYFIFEEPLKRSPSHRLLAMFRGEKEGFLRLSIDIDDEAALSSLEELFLRNSKSNSSSKNVSLAVTDGYKRLLRPSIETEFTNLARERAESDAIKVFANNLRQLLLASPLGQKSILAIDPGYRTGCKVVCLDSQGNLLHNETIYPHPPTSDKVMAMKKLSNAIEAYKIEAIAIGDGTAGRETEAFIKQMRFNRDISVFMVSEDGASVYSASTIAREEFPTYDVTVRGSVSIGRRLMDPLSELVKIDPKAIGVGQYQHDVDQTQLKNSLDTVVESCVNHVGVNLNTASRHLLAYVSGIGASLASNIVEYRAANGDFVSREQIKKVPRLGEKAFEQCAGFLRISSGKNPLDNSAVHPESYSVVEKMAKDLDVNVETLIKDKTLQEKIDINNYVTDKIGIPSLTDIMNELRKPGRDPRSEIEVFEFSPDVHTIDDLKEGMVLPGIVTNITAFGAFVDIGVKQDGLVHISQLTSKFVSSPSDVVSLHQHVQVKITQIDKSRNRIALSMKL